MGKRQPRAVVRKPRFKDELVLSIPSSIWDRNFTENERWRWGRGNVQKLGELVDNCGVMIPRSFAEKSKEFRQVIPYVIIKLKMDGNMPMWFVTKRLNTQQESRLHGMTSIGIGGHVNPMGDLRGDDLLMANVRRELDEEFDGAVEGLQSVAVVDDRDFDVSQHHVALVIEGLAEGGSVKETDLMEGSWQTVAAIRTGARLENWSELIFYKYICE
jgi:predicted NUDIX family phosphoesterase